MHIQWRYHRRFIEVASTCYTNKLTAVNRESIFQNIVDFYSEKWKHTPKPYRYNEYLQEKFHAENGRCMEKRDTCDQSTVFVDTKGKKKFNKRKITEMPGFAINLSFSLRIKIFTDVIYFDYEFLAGMFACLTFQEIIETAQLVIRPDPYISIHLGKETDKLSIDMGNLKFNYVKTFTC